MSAHPIAVTLIPLVLVPGLDSDSKSRLWLQLHLTPNEVSIADLIGRGGKNMSQIARATGAKVRVRGRGSNHKERSGKEAPVRLMICVSTASGEWANFAVAVAMLSSLLSKLGLSVEQKFQTQSYDMSLTANVILQMHGWYFPPGPYAPGLVPPGLAPPEQSKNGYSYQKSCRNI